MNVEGVNSVAAVVDNNNLSDYSHFLVAIAAEAGNFRFFVEVDVEIEAEVTVLVSVLTLASGFY